MLIGWEWEWLWVLVLLVPAAMETVVETGLETNEGQATAAAGGGGHVGVGPSCNG